MGNLQCPLHLAISLCRCMNIPARYATGYLGDIGIPPAPYPMDFSAWFEAYSFGLTLSESSERLIYQCVHRTEKFQQTLARQMRYISIATGSATELRDPG